jgi:hypothetical protein
MVENANQNNALCKILGCRAGAGGVRSGGAGHPGGVVCRRRHAEACDPELRARGELSARAHYGLMEGVKPHGGILTMQLTTGKMKYTVRGEPGVDNESGQAAFRYETNIDPRALGLVRSELFPLLYSKGPLIVKVDKNEREVPLAGIAEPLKKFSAVCFGKS